MPICVSLVRSAERDVTTMKRGRSPFLVLFRAVSAPWAGLWMRDAYH